MCTLRGGPRTLPGAPDRPLPRAFLGLGARKGSSTASEQEGEGTTGSADRGRRKLAVPSEAPPPPLHKRLLIQEPLSLHGTFLSATCSHPPLPERGGRCVASQSHREPGTRHTLLKKPRSTGHTGMWNRWLPRPRGDLPESQTIPASAAALSCLRLESESLRGLWGVKACSFHMFVKL